MPVSLDADRLAELANRVRDLRSAIECGTLTKLFHAAEAVADASMRAGIPNEIDDMIGCLTKTIGERCRSGTIIDRKCMWKVANCIENLVELV